MPESLQDEDGMGRTKGSLWAASREEPGAGPLVASAPSDGVSSQERAELTRGWTLIPTMQRRCGRRSWAKRMASGDESYANCIGRMWVSPSIFPML